MYGPIGLESRGEDLTSVGGECEDGGGFYFVEGVVRGVGCSDGAVVGVE